MADTNRVTTLEALKNLAVSMGCAATVDAVTGETIAEVIQFMADNHTASA